MAKRAAKKSKLTLRLTPEQVKALQPMLDQAGRLSLAGSVQGDKLDVSFLACNAAFLACNAAFVLGSKGAGKSR